MEPTLNPAPAQATTLDNGLEVIVREDHSAPVVSVQAWCKAGSIHEGRWLGGGLSHVLEHMLFKGTTTRSGTRIDQEIQDAGGSMNAYTSFDRTVYWVNAPSDAARVALDVLCDIVQHATLPADELVKEKDVIRREMDMNHDDPGRRSSRRLFETAYVRSPYRYTIIGYPDIFGAVTREDLLEYYRAQYAPNNLFFVVVGAVDAEAVVSQIRAATADAKPRPLSAFALAEEPRQTAPRACLEEAPIELGHVHWSWHIPGITHPDVPLLDVVAAALGSGRSARLFRSVRERKRLVHSVDAWTYSPGGAGLFGASAVLDAPNLAAAREAVFEELERLRTELLDPEELGKVVKQFTAATLGIRKTMQGQAQDLGGSWLAANDLDFSERYLAAVRNATAEDLRRVARHYLKPENRTECGLLPPGSLPKITRAAAGQREHAIQRIELRNGLRLLVKEDHRLPFVQLRAVFRGGPLIETAETSGLTLLTARTLLKGTGQRSAEQIAATIENLGGSIDRYSGRNSFGLCAETMSTDLRVLLEVASDVLRHAAFPDAEITREREVQLAGIRAQKDQLLQLASVGMCRLLFGERGYGLNPAGSEEAVAGMTAADARNLYARAAQPSNCVLALYGDVNAAEVRAIVEDGFGSWAASAAPVPEAAAACELAGIARAVELRDKKQAVLVLGFPGVTMFDPDRYALELLQQACSDLGSRLFLRIRDELGLAYYVGAQNFCGLTPGYFSFYCGTAPEHAERVEREILIEVEALRERGLDPAELRRAKAKVLGHHKIERQELGAMAFTNALDELYGLGCDHYLGEDAAYEAVTLEHVQAAARRCLTPDRYAITIVRPS